MTKYDTHNRHSAQKSYDLGWSYCVAPHQDHSEKAHGNIVQVDECSCGSTRYTEINGFGRGSKVSSGWQEPK